MAEVNNKIDELAKKAAVINVYAVINPLLDLFTTANATLAEQATEENELAREKNGEKMYTYIKAFLDEFANCDMQSQKKVFSLYNKYHDEELEKYLEIIRLNTGMDLSCGFAFNQSKDDNENISIEVETWRGEMKKVVIFP